jgi:C-terminal processing protease CtpA/Prc
MERGQPEEKQNANLALLDYAVGTVNTMYYDHTGGIDFQPKDFYSAYKAWMRAEAPTNLQDRSVVVQELKSLISSLNDPFSKYMTRDELKKEMSARNDGFLGLGAIVEMPSKVWFMQTPPVTANLPTLPLPTTHSKPDTRLAVSKIVSLPLVTAVAPDSPAERAGLTVGDRIVAVGQDVFLGKTEKQLEKHLLDKYSAENYIGHPSLTIAKPVFAAIQSGEALTEKDVTVAYRPVQVRLPTALVEPFQLKPWEKGNAIVHYQLLSSDDSIFAPQKVGYIRLTRFSKASTSGFVKAATDLEMRGATSYIIDLRNNYGGVIQEAMLTASTLLREPHLVLCYTMNSRGGFTTHDVEEYVVDARYPGYLLSDEPHNVVLAQVKRENPSIFELDGVHWSPPSSFASLHEQGIKRGLRRHVPPAYYSSIRNDGLGVNAFRHDKVRPIVVLVNEGTASSAEVFASALRDNGRTVALVGTKTFGKGLIQHTFPMPDGGALKLTVAEYLTPALRHVTKVGGAQYSMGERIGGGILPDIVCESNQGIPSNVGADLCVGVALDALKEADSAKRQWMSSI